MDIMDRLFDLYNDYFERLVEAHQRLDARFPHPSRFPHKRKTRDEFEDYLINGADSEWKRSFLILVLDDRNELYPLLPDSVKKTLDRTAA